MKYMAAYILLALAGNKSPTEKDIEKVLKEVGAKEVDKDKITQLIKAINSQKLHDLYKKGSEKFVSMPAASGAVAVSAPVAAAGASTKKEEPKKEEPKEEPADVDMGGLFGDEY
mmetsp:Transcript_7347/g.5618  ORF Transcript_7347/g.5618 Transcript_7347/m.5618 type:complete len:114 (+) Transcript_7347:23-364(+)